MADQVGSVNHDNNNKLVLNELLTYSWHYKNTCSSQNIEGTVYNFYSDDEVLEARRKLLKVVKGVDAASRRDCKGHLAKMKNVNDILKVLKELDESGNIEGFNFAACNLDRVPKYAPDDVETLNLIATVGVVKAELTALRSDFTSLSNEFDNYKKVPKAPAPTPVTSFADIVQNEVTPKKSKKLVVVPSQAPPDHHTKVRPTTASDDETSHSDDAEGFTLQRHSRKKLARKAKATQVVCGTHKSAGGVPKKSALFVYNCKSDCNVDWLKTFIESEDNFKVGVPTLEVWDLNKKTANPVRKSFKILIDSQYDDVLFTHDFWPSNVKMRRWKQKPPPTRELPGARGNSIKPALEPPAPALEPPAPVLEPPSPALEPPEPVLEPPAPALEPPAPVDVSVEHVIIRNVDDQQ